MPLVQSHLEQDWDTVEGASEPALLSLLVEIRSP